MKRKKSKFGIFTLIFNTISYFLFSVSLAYSADPDIKSTPEFTIDFESGKSSLIILQASADLQIQGPQFSSEHPAQGKSCEELLIGSRLLGEKVVMGINIPSARMIQDSKVSLKVHSPQASCVLSVSVIFPETIDPRTNKPFIGFIYSEPQKANKDWGNISIQITDEVWQERIRLWKAQLRPQLLDTRQAYINQSQLHIDCEQGKTMFG